MSLKKPFKYSSIGDAMGQVPNEAYIQFVR